jgi:phage-related protein
MANFNVDVNINPDKGLQSDFKPNVSVAVYGDGYEQRVATGINNTGESWNLSWNNRSFEDISKILLFLESLGGVSSFDWYPPGSQVTGEVGGPGGISTYLDRTVGVGTQVFTNRLVGNTVYVDDSSLAPSDTGEMLTVINVISATRLELSGSIIPDWLGLTFHINPYKNYKCSKWKVKEVANGFRTLTATFTKVFDL